MAYEYWMSSQRAIGGAVPSDDRTFVIVGAALAGAKAAETLRTEGFEGRVILIGDEDVIPYERPPLSKDYLRGEVGPEKAQVHEQSYYPEHEIDLRLGTRVTAIDPGAGQVALGDGDQLGFDRLLLAPGAAPRRLDIAGSDLEGIYYLRTMADCDRLRARLDAGGHVAVIGAGWIGAEVAASARQRGLEVTLIAPESVPLERVLGVEVGAIYRDIHADHGVRLRMGTGVEAFEGAGSVERIRATGGDPVDCDFVVVGVGVTPRVELAKNAGLSQDDGILVDASLQTSAPNVWAAGDAARAEHPLLGHSIRVEHWANALEQGPAAARSMLGQRVSYDRVPYFFSDQYDVGMEYCGYPVPWDRVVFRGDPGTREFIVFWIADDRVVAAMNVNVWDVNESLQELVRRGRPVDEARLRDTEVGVEELLDS
jgi:3-phenylpropionate/trans-cinnamate dioxygenase ferredoxin reductase subunit